MTVISFSLSETRYRALQEAARRLDKSIEEVIDSSLELAGIEAYENESKVSEPFEKVPAYLQVLEKYTYFQVGYIGDMSKNGFMLVARRKYELEQSRELLVKLPQNEDVGKEYISIQAEVRWITQDPNNAAQYHMGLHFQLIAPEDHATLQRIFKKQDTVKEKRTQRKPLLFYLDVLQAPYHEVLGWLGDISQDGMLILSEKEIPLQRELDIRIKLPNVDDFPRPFLDLRVETRWIRPDADLNLHLVGCRFIDITQDKLLLLEQVQEVLSFS